MDINKKFRFDDIIDESILLRMNLEDFCADSVFGREQ